ncbi:hypothetical protein LDENG_00234010 [Lucifuga dentata]|nr:hypothetical protein LDENG_00234010 [Lucifuga dentata]
MQKARWELSSHPPFHTVAWQPSLACQSKSNCYGPCRTGSKLMSTSLLALMPLRMQLTSSWQTKREWQQLWRTPRCWRWSTNA